MEDPRDWNWPVIAILLCLAVVLWVVRAPTQSDKATAGRDVAVEMQGARPQLAGSSTAPQSTTNATSAAQVVPSAVLSIKVVDGRTGEAIAGASAWAARFPKGALRVAGTWGAAAAEAVEERPLASSTCGSEDVSLPTLLEDVVRPLDAVQSDHEGLVAVPLPAEPLGAAEVLGVVVAHSDYAGARFRVDAGKRADRREVKLYKAMLLDVPVWVEGTTEVPAPAGLAFEFTEEHGRRFTGRVEEAGRLVARILGAPLYCRTCDPAWFVVGRQQRIAQPLHLNALHIQPCPVIRIVDARTGAAVQQISLLVTHGQWSRQGAFAARDGRYALLWSGVQVDTRLGPYKVAVAAPGYRPSVRALETVSTGEVVEIALEPDPAAGVRVRVFDGDRPLAGVPVQVSRSPRDGSWGIDELLVVAAGLSDARGDAHLAVPPGSHILVVQSPTDPKDPLTRPIVVEAQPLDVEIDFSTRGTLVLTMQAADGSVASRRKALVLETTTGRRSILVGDKAGLASVRADPGVAYRIAEAIGEKNAAGSLVLDESVRESETRQITLTLAPLESTREPRVVVSGTEGREVMYRASDRGDWTPLPATGEIDQHPTRGRTFMLHSETVRLQVSIPARTDQDLHFAWPTGGAGYDVAFAVPSAAPQWVRVLRADADHSRVRWSAEFAVGIEGVAEVRGLAAGPEYLLVFESPGEGFPFLYRIGIAPTAPATQLRLDLPRVPSEQELLPMRGHVRSAEDQSPLARVSIKFRAITPRDTQGGEFLLSLMQSTDHATGEDGSYALKVPPAETYEVVVMRRRRLDPGYDVMKMRLQGYEPVRDIVVR